MAHVGRFGVKGATAAAALAFSDGTAVSVVEVVRDESLLAQWALPVQDEQLDGSGRCVLAHVARKGIGIGHASIAQGTLVGRLRELVPQLMGAYVALIVVRLVARVAHVARYRGHMHQTLVLVGQLLAEKLFAANAANGLAADFFPWSLKTALRFSGLLFAGVRKLKVLTKGVLFKAYYGYISGSVLGCMGADCGGCSFCFLCHTNGSFLTCVLAIRLLLGQVVSSPLRFLPRLPAAAEI